MLSKRLIRKILLALLVVLVVAGDVYGLISLIYHFIILPIFKFLLFISIEALLGGT